MEEKKFYLTKEGLERIKEEYNNLKSLRLAKSKEGIPNIFESEDINSEYLVFQDDLNFLETRLAELEMILKHAQVISPPPKEKRNIVDIGAKVQVEVDGQIDEFEIVGSLEANPALGKISSDSPVGRALLGHKVGDEVVVSSPVKTIYKIKKIKYQIS